MKNELIIHLLKLCEKLGTEPRESEWLRHTLSWLEDFLEEIEAGNDRFDEKFLHLLVANSLRDIYDREIDAYREECIARHGVDPATA